MWTISKWLNEFSIGNFGLMTVKKKEMKIYFYQMIHFSIKRKLNFDNFVDC